MGVSAFFLVVNAICMFVYAGHKAGHHGDTFITGEWAFFTMSGMVSLFSAIVIIAGIN